MALERIKNVLPSGWYVPYAEIEPLPTPGGYPAKYIWQAFPFLKNFFTNYGECVHHERLPLDHAAYLVSKEANR